MHAHTDVAATREQEIEVLDAWQITLARRQLHLRAALGTIDLAPATTAGGVLSQVHERAELLHNLDALAVADAECEAAMVRTCLTHYSRCLTERAARPATPESYFAWVAEGLHRGAK